eukprot:g20653.t1
MTVLALPPTAPALAANESGLPASTEAPLLTKRQRKNKAKRQRKKRRKLETASQAEQQVTGGLAVLNIRKPFPVASAAVVASSDSKAGAPAMSDWLWMSWAPTYSGG